MHILIEEHKHPVSIVSETLEGLTSFRDNSELILVVE